MKTAKEIARTAFDARDMHEANRKIRRTRIRNISAFCGAVCALCLTIGGISHLDSMHRSIPSTLDDSKAMQKQTFVKCPEEMESAVIDDEKEETVPETEQAVAENTEILEMMETIEVCTQIHLPNIPYEPDTAPEDAVQTNTVPALLTEMVCSVATEAVQTNTVSAAKTEAPSNTTTENEMAIIPQWDEKTMMQRFSECHYNGARYAVSGANCFGAQLGELLGSVTLTGYDIYTDTIHEADAQVYAINGIAQECAVAVQFQGYTESIIYTGHSYFPATLGQLMDDLHLTETLSFHTLYPNRSITGTTNYDVSLLMEMLEKNRSAPLVQDDHFRDHLFGVSTNIDILGITNKSTRITKDGYLTMNLLGPGYLFYIGEDAAAELADALGIAEVPLSTNAPANMENVITSVAETIAE